MNWDTFSPFIDAACFSLLCCLWVTLMLRCVSAIANHLHSIVTQNRLFLRQTDVTKPAHQITNSAGGVELPAKLLFEIRQRHPSYLWQFQQGIQLCMGTN